LGSEEGKALGSEAGKALGSEAGKAIGSGLCYERWIEVEQSLYCVFYRDFYVTIRRAAFEKCSAKWNLGINAGFSLGPKKTMKNFNR
jgi:hypothetical protein